MLRNIQARLVELYDVDPGIDVEDFLVGEETARALGGDDAPRRGEVLFVIDGAEPRVALFLDPSAHHASVDGLADPARASASALATEGISHLVYVAFRAEHAHEVSEIELELQAEIDKWALGLLAPWRDVDHAQLLVGRGTALIAMRDRSRRLREIHFERAAFHDAAGTERGDRYRDATRLAARYASELERRYVERGDVESMARELRRFYRLGARGKIERIG
jgi:hypothetical protein